MLVTRLDDNWEKLLLWTSLQRAHCGVAGLTSARPRGQNVPDRKAQVKAVGGVTKHNDICIFRLQKVQKKMSVPSRDQKGCVAQER